MKKQLARAVSCLLCLSLLLGMIAPAAAAGDPSADQSAANAESMARAGEGSADQISSTVETVPINNYSGGRRSILFDENWKFNLGNVSGAQAKVFDDSAWRTVNLPHDFSIEQDYTSSGEAESGYLPGGTGWYRKSFTVDPDWAGKTVTIDFGGAYMDTEVYLNGEKLGEHHYGYSPFSFVLPLDCDGENVIAVKVTNTIPSSRWYSGSGIYRSVYLTVSDPVHVARYGTYVTTTNAGAVAVKTNVQNDGAAAASFTVKQEIFELDGTTFEAKGAAVATNTSSAASVAAGGTSVVSQDLNVTSPKLWNSWDKGEPNLYVLKTTVLVDGVETDTYETEFGFREIDWDVDTGFKLNGENLKLKGVCQHHDQGALGAEAWYRALERQVDILMEMGCNSIRVTHNPAADELIEICNRKGVLVVDELFDGWAHAKNGNSYDFSRWFNHTLGAGNNLVGGSADMKWQQYVTESVVNRDKNAPCVIMYSLCNEVQEGGSIDSNYPTYANEMIGWIQAIDSTRYITRGDNTRTASNTGNQGLINKALNEAGGAVGFNYYAGSANPILPGHNMGWLMYAAETASATNSRGIYDRKNSNGDGGAGDGLVTSYDKSCVGWGATASDAWWRTIQYDYSAGEYVWTGFDYIGEPTPWNGTGSGQVGTSWPKSSYFGIIDTGGIPKDSYYLYRSMWNDDSHTLHVLPTWDRDDLVITNGKVEVVVYTDAPVVKLYLNGTEVGSATSTTNTTAAGHVYRTFDNGTGAFVRNTGHQSLYATFNVDYAAGTLEARAFEADGTTPITDTEGRSQVKTTSAAARLEVNADRSVITNDGRDLSYITIDVVDASGEIINGATPEITVEVTGDGVLMGLDNGVQPDHTSYLSDTRQAGAGRLVAIVQSTKDAGTITVTATTASGLSGSTTVTTEGVDRTEEQTNPVSYEISKIIYVKPGVVPTLPASIKVNLANGSSETVAPVWNDTWDRDLLNTAGNEIGITGTITVNGENIPISLGIVVMDEVAALLNYSTVIPFGSKNPILPASRPAVMADGTVLNAQFPVTWTRPADVAYAQPGMVVITGTANVFGTDLTVTAWVRVAEGGVTENNGSVSNAVTRPTVNGAAENDLLKAYDEDPNTVWTGSGATNVEFDTAQNLYKIKLTYQGDVPASGVTITLDGGPVTVAPTVSGSTATYELGSINSSVNVTINFANEVSLAEVELITGTPTFDIYDTAALDKLNINGEDALALAGADARVIKTSMERPAIVPVTGQNVAWTMLPVKDDTVIIITESEDNNTRDKYTVYLDAPADVAADDDSRDYDRTKTTATVLSQHGANTGATEGPASFAVDGNENSYWHSRWSDTDNATGTAGNSFGHGDLVNYPEERYIQLELEEATALVALRYKPRPAVANGIVTKYRVEVSTDGVNFTTVAEGDWAHNTVWKAATFNQEVTAKYVRLYGVETRGGNGDTPNKFMSCAELRVVMPETPETEKKDLSLATVEIKPTTEFEWTGAQIHPHRVDVTLDGVVLEEGVDYELAYEDNRDPGTAYVYVIAKEGSNYQGSAYATFTIIRTDATIERLLQRTIWIQEGVEPILPGYVMAAMSDGTTLAQPVVWEAVTSDKYINPALDEFTVSGTVTGADGTEIAATLKVYVARALSVDSVSLMTAVGTPPDLPATVNVQFSDGSSRRCAVEWDMPAGAWNSEGLVSVTGAVTNISRLTANASVRVAVGTPDTDTNIALNNNSSSNIFPFAMAYVSSGNNNPYQAIKGTTTGSTAATDRWSDWERNTYHTSPLAWMGVAFETSTTLGARQQSQVLTLRPHLVNQVKVMFVDEDGTGGAVTFPASYKIQYYDGDYTGITFDTRETVESLLAGGNGAVRSWTNSPLLVESNWKDVTLADGGSYPAVPSTNGQMLTIDIEPVNTTIIRVVCTPQSNKWSGIQALEVYGLELPEAQSTFTITGITLGGEDKKAEFAASTDNVLEIELDENDPIPELAITVDTNDNASVSITQASQVPGMPQPGVAWATATVTSEDGSTTETYTVKFTRTGAPEGYAIRVLAGSRSDKIILSDDYAQAGDKIIVSVAEGYELSNLGAVITACSHPGNIHAGMDIPVDTTDNSFIMREGEVSIGTTVRLINYSVSYELDGGAVPRPNPTIYTVEDATSTLYNPTKSGYTFQGWTHTGVDEQPATTMRIEQGSTGDLSFTAHWRQNTTPDTPEPPDTSIEPSLPVISTKPEPPTTPDTTTTVVENEDGSTTTTVTNNETGLVTETTEKADGGTVVKVTEPNKDVTITVTDPDGETLIEVKLPSVIPEPDVKFVDVADGHWAEDAIYQAAGLGLVKGVGGNRFNWKGDMKRGDLAAVLFRLSNGSEGCEMTFNDVPSIKYYADSVAWAASTGVVTGYSDTTFGPEDTITREQLAVMLYRYAKLLHLDTAASASELDVFADGGDTHGWAQEGVAWCVKNGILQGKGNGVLDPRADVTRAEVAVMLQRFIDLMK